MTIKGVPTVGRALAPAFMVSQTGRTSRNYLREGKASANPSSLAISLVAIGAHHCGLNGEKIAQLLTKLAEDGAFQVPGPERLMPPLDEVAASAPHMKHAFS